MIEQFKQIKVLSLSTDTSISKKLLHVLSRDLPNLQELHIESSKTSDLFLGCSLDSIINTFVRYAPNLKTISLKDIEYVNFITKKNFFAADCLRKKVRDAKVLTIHLDYAYVHSSNKLDGCNRFSRTD